MNCKKPKLSGPLYKHLGHFSQDKCVQQGHNDSGKIQIQYKGSVPSVEIESEKESESDDSESNGEENGMMSSSMKSMNKKKMMEE